MRRGDWTGSHKSRSEPILPALRFQTPPIGVSSLSPGCRGGCLIAFFWSSNIATRKSCVPLGSELKNALAAAMRVESPIQDSMARKISHREKFVSGVDDGAQRCYRAVLRFVPRPLPSILELTEGV